MRAQSLHTLMQKLLAPRLRLITGDAVGSAYIALAGKGANADMVMAWPSAMISAFSPDAAVEILWHEKLAGLDKAGREQLTEEYKNTLASPLEAAKTGISIRFLSRIKRVLT